MQISFLFSFAVKIMFYYDVNYLTVIVATIASFVIGFLWYGPVFGKQWIKMMGYTKESMSSMKMKPMTAMALGFLSNLVMAYAVSVFASIWMYDGLYGAFKLSFLLWLGFVAVTSLGAVLWENRSWNLFLFNTVYQFLILFVMASIIFMWK